MKRRTLLRVAGAAGAGGLGGCVGGRGPADDDRSDARTTSGDPTVTPRTDGSPTPREVEGGSDRTPTTTPTAGVPRTVAVEAVDDEPLRDRFGVTADVEVVEPAVTPEHTARVRVTLRADGQSRTLTYVREECGLNVLYATRRRDDARLVLVAGVDWESTRDDCWRPDPRNLNCGIPAVEETVTVAPGDPLTWAFTVWNAGDGADTCMPPGRYRAVRAFERGEGDDDGRVSGETATLTVDLHVSVPENPADS